MKIADLYIRISTDEPADKGYSKTDQEKILRRFCIIQSMRIGKVIYEDHSAKTFRRPKWTKLMPDLRRHKRHADLILFTTWDRFSTNAENAYRMSNILRKLGTELQAIEQPLDLSIPENKLILAFYLAIRRVENDRRAPNTFFGLCRVKTEGRWIASTPLGCKNKTSKNETKYLEIEKSLAALIPWSFIEIAKRTYNTEQIWKEAKRKGLKCSKKSFWSMIRNPIYCGKIFIPKYKEEAHYVQGIHKPLASQELFYRVQDILDGRKKKQRRQILVGENLPLRGFFICLRKFAPRSEMVELNKAFIQNLYKNKSRVNNKEFKDILVRFHELNNMISYFEHLDYAF